VRCLNFPFLGICRFRHLFYPNRKFIDQVILIDVILTFKRFQEDQKLVCEVTQKPAHSQIIFYNLRLFEALCKFEFNGRQTNELRSQKSACHSSCGSCVEKVIFLNQSSCIMTWIIFGEQFL